MLWVVVRSKEYVHSFINSMIRVFLHSFNEADATCETLQNFIWYSLPGKKIENNLLSRYTAGQSLLSICSPMDEEFGHLREKESCATWIKQSQAVLWHTAYSNQLFHIAYLLQTNWKIRLSVTDMDKMVSETSSCQAFRYGELLSTVNKARRLWLRYEPLLSAFTTRTLIT